MPRACRMIGDSGGTVRDGSVWASYDFANPAKLRGVTVPLDFPREPGTHPS